MNKNNKNPCSLNGLKFGFAEHFSSGDIEAFFGVFADVFSKISVIIGVLLFGEKMPKELVLGRILPGIAAGSILGCLIYFWEAHKLGIKENRKDVTALPFGVSSTHVFTWLFIIIVPVYRQTGDAYFAWQVGLASCFCGGFVEIAGGFIARPIKKFLPQAALLSNMAAASLIWLSFNSMTAIFSKPLIAVLPLFMAFLTLSWHKNFIRFIPNSALILLAGSLAAWLSGVSGTAQVQEAVNDTGLYLPSLYIKDIFLGLNRITPYLSTIIPLQIANFLVTMQAVESAETVGDAFNMRETMIKDGITSIVSALFGSPFPTTVYYGHTGWKRSGARSGYMLLLILPYTAMFFGASLLLSAVIPFEVIMVFLLTVGITVAMKVQNDLPHDYSAVIYVSLFPIMAQYITSLLDSVLHFFNSSIFSYGLEKFDAGGTAIRGLFYLSNGAFASSFMYSVWIAYILQKNYLRAATAAFLLAVLSSVGFIHQPSLSWLPKDNIKFVLVYLLIGIFCFILYKRNKSEIPL
ncbi:hypothetical protein [Treponema pedis]|uniref:Putative xanthine/uracil/vitamin C permease n=1 Tax=Treponema pedis str. T A4 TaxID=1291379 RepID=S5ZX15_9SPIR|nr:hypothetical protein [Treponema pedis]AGT42543.1 putative xanthine/uracil/vitamin C permease [Treponema pedis str. T A4]